MLFNENTYLQLVKEIFYTYKGLSIKYIEKVHVLEKNGKKYSKKWYEAVAYRDRYLMASGIADICAMSFQNQKHFDFWFNKFCKKEGEIHG